MDEIESFCVLERRHFSLYLVVYFLKQQKLEVVQNGRMEKNIMIKEWKFWLLFLVLSTALLYGEFTLGEKNLMDVAGVVIALLAAVLLMIELKRNKDVNEAQLIVEINNEFINNFELTKVEHRLEEYFFHYRNGKNKEEIRLKLALGISKRERQQLVNYLVHLEGVAALVNSNVLRLKAITDLVAYRYFIAVNNPVVQEIELIPYKDYYKGCRKIYKKWSRRMNKAKIEVPMEEYSLIKEIEKSEKKNGCNKKFNFRLHKKCL